ncbi:MAG: hypothetical protein OXI81_16525 [Paracoccaceae bacterium]|nr:hypothetical protein [Paracoccaceae bacterium]
MMTALLPLMSVIEGGSKFAQLVKSAVEFQGVPAGSVRPPTREMKKEPKRELRQILETATTTLGVVRSGATGGNEVKNVRRVGKA